ncbi:metal-dependent protein hydrolase, partial [Caulochytrium protostelioides]
HSGTFHADEALAIAMLKRLPAYANATVVRTRNPAVYNAADIVVDVGGVYDPARHRYDHHQREFTDTYSSDHAVRLSSAGLVYK